VKSNLDPEFDGLITTITEPGEQYNICKIVSYELMLTFSQVLTPKEYRRSGNEVAPRAAKIRKDQSQVVLH
jgi:hypothetical protein